MKTNKRYGLNRFLLIMAIAIVMICGCIHNSDEKTSEPIIPPPSTTSATAGYIQSYDHELNYGYDYPETWTMHGPDEFQLIDGIKNVEMFVEEPEATTITIIAKTTKWKNLEEAKNTYRDAYGGPETILEERDIEVNGIKGYEIIRLETPIKSKYVIFIANDMLYEIDCHALEDLYDTSEVTFDHVINSFNIR